MTEADLALKFIDYLSDGHEIYKEVPCDGIVDIVAVAGNIQIAVEVKKNLSFEVIHQAQKNLHWFNYSYIAVPEPKRKHFGYHVCRMLGIGVLIYAKEQPPWIQEQVREVVKPKLQRNAARTGFRYKVKLKDYMKESTAGSQNDRMTAFKNTIIGMEKFIQRHPGCTLNECLENVDFHWSSMSSAKSCVKRWISNGVIKEFTIEDGCMKIVHGREVLG